MGAVPSWLWASVQHGHRLPLKYLGPLQAAGVLAGSRRTRRRGAPATGDFGLHNALASERKAIDDEAAKEIHNNLAHHGNKGTGASGGVRATEPRPRAASEGRGRGRRDAPLPSQAGAAPIEPPSRGVRRRALAPPRTPVTSCARVCVCFTLTRRTAGPSRPR